MSQVITAYHRQRKHKVTKSDISQFSRLERLRLHQDWTWAQVGEAIGVKTAMIMMVKSGQRNLSAKSLYKLEQIEKELGFEPPSTITGLYVAESPPREREAILALRIAAKRLRAEADHLDEQASKLESQY